MTLAVAPTRGGAGGPIVLGSRVFRVLVSSTFADMVAERNRALDRLPAE